MNFIHKLEPIWWMLFGAGAMLIVFLGLPMFAGVLVLAPLGAFGDGMSWRHAHGLAASPVGKLFFCVLIPLIFWHCAHHLRHFALDVFGHAAAPVAAVTSYGLALVGTIATILVVSGL